MESVDVFKGFILLKKYVIEDSKQQFLTKKINCYELESVNLLYYFFKKKEYFFKMQDSKQQLLT